MTLAGADLAPLMLLVLVPLLMSGVPVVLALVACGLGFGALGIVLGLVPAQLVQALPIRLHFIVANETLLAIPFFTLMGMVLQRSGLAQDLLHTAAEVFGRMRGGLAFAVVLVGGLLAATTGVVASAVISMGLVSLPVMLRHRYDPRLACGVIAASGSLTQVVPPSIVLIVMADQLGIGVGDLYVGVLIPAALLITAYAAWITIVAVVRPRWVPAVAVGDPVVRGGHRSLLALALASVPLGALMFQGYPALLQASGRFTPPGLDESVIVGFGCVVVAAFVLAGLDRLSGARRLSPLAQRVAFVLIPPLLLIFLVLGSIFLGAATPTEGSAFGASGAMAMAMLRRRLTWAGLTQALRETTELSCMVMMLMFGATVFSLSFQALDGIVWVQQLLTHLPAGVPGFLLFVSLLVFVLGCFLDFFEIALVLLPLLGPVAAGMGIDLVWFAVLIGINLQTSFLTPPFGYALFFLRGVLPGGTPVAATVMPGVPAVGTRDIYRGVMPFVAIQLLVMGLVIAYPQLVLDAGARSRRALDDAAIVEQLRAMPLLREEASTIDATQRVLENLTPR